MSKDTWREWIDLDAPGAGGFKLLDDAPQEEKDKFEEWKQGKEQERAEGKWI